MQNTQFCISSIYVMSEKNLSTETKVIAWTSLCLQTEDDRPIPYFEKYYKRT